MTMRDRLARAEATIERMARAAAVAADSCAREEAYNPTPMLRRDPDADHVRDAVLHARDGDRGDRMRPAFDPNSYRTFCDALARFRHDYLICPSCGRPVRSIDGRAECPCGAAFGSRDADPLDPPWGEGP